MKLLDSIIGTYSDRQIRKILPVVKKIEALAEKYKAMERRRASRNDPGLKGASSPQAKPLTIYCPMLLQ